MSQTSAFYKAQNPDFVYLDLQQSNVYNNTNGQEVDVNFVETRDSPVVANTGEYHMSVTRFQIDTYNLPTLVVEPDLTQGNPNKTIHKVAILTEAATQVNSNPVEVVTELSVVTAPTADTLFGSQVRYAQDINRVVIGAPLTASAKGAVFVSDLGSASPAVVELLGFTGDVGADANVGQSVDITHDGLVIVSLRYNDAASVNGLELISWKLATNGYIPQTAVPCVFVDSSVDKDDNVIRVSRISPNPACARVAVVGCESLGQVFIYGLNANNRIVTTQVFSQSTQTSQYGASVAISDDGKVIAIGNPEEADGTSVAIQVLEWSPAAGIYVSRLSYIPTAGTTRNVGFSLAMSADGEFIVSGAPTDDNNLGRVDIIQKTAANTWTHKQSMVGTTASLEFGQSVALSNDGNTLAVGWGNNPNVDVTIYKRADDSTSYVFATTKGNAPSSSIVITDVLLMNGEGNRLVQGYGPSSGTGKVVFQSFTDDVSPYVDYLPSANKNIASVANVIWEPNPIYPTPQNHLLTGKNTVESPYFWCNSYDYFIKLVNKALEQASADNYNYLYQEWVSGVTGNTAEGIKGVFFDAAYKSFPTPPFLDWEADTLKASMYVNQCYNRFIAANYAIPPITWASEVGTSGRPPPFAFRVALNPSLYALFNSFPATETLLTTTTGTVEKFYVLDINSTGYPLVTPSPTIQRTLYSAYVFNSLIYSNSTFLYTLLGDPPPAYPYANEFIKVNQELSTIDTWCPVNGIVFATNTLPIVTNQFSSNSVINTDRPSFETGAQYGLIITDLQTNEQGYKPNLLYNPTAEYRRIDMTGNRGLTNIDIRVFWRAKTGQLIPFKLSSGVSASIKILFQKKILGEKQKIQMAQTIKELETPF